MFPPKIQDFAQDMFLIVLKMKIQIVLHTVKGSYPKRLQLFIIRQGDISREKLIAIKDSMLSSVMHILHISGV
jgi:uncharacterized protein YeeX (DUF496 family)